MREQKTAWAIETNYTDIDGSKYNGFIGIYYFQRETTKPYQSLTTATFSTREEARRHLPIVKTQYGFPKAKVVKITITKESKWTSKE